MVPFLGEKNYEKTVHAFHDFKAEVPLRGDLCKD